MIDLVNVTKTYETGTHALNGIDMHIDDGEFVFLVGPSGSGKTTLMNIIGCMDRSEAACVDYGWTAVAKTSRIARKPTFARVNRRKYCPFCSGSFRAICR